MQLEFHLIRSLPAKLMPYKVELRKVGRSIRHTLGHKDALLKFKTSSQVQEDDQCQYSETQHFLEISESPNQTFDADLPLSLRVELSPVERSLRPNSEHETAFRSCAQLSVRRVGQTDFHLIPAVSEICDSVGRVCRENLFLADDRVPTTITVHGHAVMEVRHGANEWVFGRHPTGERESTSMIPLTSAAPDEVVWSVIAHLHAVSPDAKPISHLVSLWRILGAFLRAGELLVSGPHQEGSRPVGANSDSWCTQLTSSLIGLTVEPLLATLKAIPKNSDPHHWTHTAISTLNLILTGFTMNLQDRSLPAKSLCRGSHLQTGSILGFANNSRVLSTFESVHDKRPQVLRKLWQSCINKVPSAVVASNSKHSSAYPPQSQSQLPFKPEAIFQALSEVYRQLASPPARNSPFNFGEVTTCLYSDAGRLLTKDRVVGAHSQTLRCVLGNHHLVMAKGKLIAKPLSSSGVTSMRVYSANSCLRPRELRYQNENTQGLYAPDFKPFRKEEDRLSLFTRLDNGFDILEVRTHPPDDTGKPLSVRTDYCPSFASKVLDIRGVDHSFLTFFTSPEFSTFYALVYFKNKDKVTIYGKLGILDADHELLTSMSFDDVEISKAKAEPFAYPVPINFIQDPPLSQPVDYSTWVRIYSTVEKDEDDRRLDRVFISSHAVRVEADSRPDSDSRYLVFTHLCTSLHLGNDILITRRRPKAPIFRRVIAKIPIPRCTQPNKDLWLFDFSDSCFKHLFVWKQVFDRIFGIRIDQRTRVYLVIFAKGKFHMVSGGSVRGIAGKILSESADAFTHSPVFTRTRPTSSTTITCSMYQIDLVRT